jgi:hypothetical protein
MVSFHVWVTGEPSDLYLVFFPVFISKVVLAWIMMSVPLRMKRICFLGVILRYAA